MNLFQANVIDRYLDSRFDEQEAAQNKLRELAKSVSELNPRDREVVMNFLCKDPAFEKLTGGDYKKLMKITGSMERETVGSIAIILLLGLVPWRIWHWVDQKTPTGLIGWLDEQGDQLNNVDILERRCRVPQLRDLQVLQAGITKSCDLIGKIASGKNVSDAEIGAAAKALQMEPTMSKFDNYGGHLLAFLASLGMNWAYGFGAYIFIVLGTMISAGILFIPAAVVSIIMMVFKTSATYKRVYEAMAGDMTLNGLGYTLPAIKQAVQIFRSHYTAMRQYCSRFDSISQRGSISLPTTQSVNHLHALCDVLYYSLKAEARIIGTIAAVSGNLGPTDFSD